MAEAIERGQTIVGVSASPSATRPRPRPDPRLLAVALFGLRAAAIASVAAGIVTFGIQPLQGHFAGQF